jgi:hypothetical protein
MSSTANAVPGWFAAGSRGASVAVADISGNGRPDLVVFHPGDPTGDNLGYYRIGWNLDTAGNATGWSGIRAVPGPCDAEERDASVAVADISGNGRPDLVVFHPGGDHGYYRIGRDLDNTGDVTGGWGPITAVPGPCGARDRGAGIALADIDGTGRPDLIVFHVDDPRGDNHGYYRVITGL